jgi:glutamate synthase (NADPH) large chain
MNQKNKSLYDPSFEHDACGIGFIANLKGKKSNDLIQNALSMLENMEHRGATGYEPNSGDGAGVLIQMPHDFFKEECGKIGINLPNFGEYGVAMTYFPKDVKIREACRRMFSNAIDEMGLNLLGFRDVPVNRHDIGATALSAEPKIEQVFIAPKGKMDTLTLERKLYVLRNWIGHSFSKEFPAYADDFYIATCSHSVIVYKGQLTTFQVRKYFLDLTDSRVVSGLAMIHSRFSTNTFPKWKLAQPFRYVAHNGEINTVRGNVNWSRSNETLLESSLFTQEEIARLKPICDYESSDSANLDNMIELLTLSGRSLPHVMMMLIPEAWQGQEDMPDPKKAFYEYHATIMEPWDGPASISFTDGKIIGATLDRNGLRPSRYCLTDDGTLIMSSEAGAFKVPEDKIVEKGRLQPGKMFVADLEKGMIISDDEIKSQVCSQAPYREWLSQNSVSINTIPAPAAPAYNEDAATLLQRQIAFGLTQEDKRNLLAPIITKKTDPLGSMGTDAPLAILSSQSQHLSNYFKQQFAQVSNPPIDAIREKIIMSLLTHVSRSFNILAETSLHCKQITFTQPVLSNGDIEKLRQISHPDFRVKQINAVFNADGKPGRLKEALDAICAEVDAAILDKGFNVLLISDREMTAKMAAIPSLLAVGAIHRHLILNGLRVRVGIVVEAGDARETHHFATLISYGANAINPYLTFETMATLPSENYIPADISREEINQIYTKVIGAGLLKIFSKMGISTLQSYKGAQIFEAFGLSDEVIDECFNGTISRIGGLSFDDIAEETLIKHRTAYPAKKIARQRLEEGGVHQWKERGEKHLFNPETIAHLQFAVRNNDYSTYKKYAELINDQSENHFTLRGLMEFKKRKPVPLQEVEPKENIFKRFATGAMSFGSISHEAHTTLAIAMNRIGGKSNSGEGGEDEIRFQRKENGDWERSAIKQVASGRFGVTSNYLANCDEIQIKMAQGAKPGEGGQLPGHKVDDWIGRVRHSTPGVGLISPPPHHDIYSIEDLAQLIFDLKNANPAARINVKLVAKAGVGTIAAGVAKAFADVVLISGHDGGTGASPLSSIHHTGAPWEMGLSEAHQTLVWNKLRNRITVQADGQMKTGRDLAIAALLGAEEWGVATAALVAEGCIMMRKCHLNTCPVGVATQNKELRKLFTGQPEHIVNLFTFMAEELREIMAELGFRTVNEMIGQVGALRQRDDIFHWKAGKVDLSRVLYKQEDGAEVGLYKTLEQKHQIDNILDRKLIEVSSKAIEKQEPVTAEFPIFNTDRAVGTMLSYNISSKYGSAGLPDDTIKFNFRGSAGQSFAAFGAKGLSFTLEGEANDYFGKGLSGAKMVVKPDRTSTLVPEKNVIVGNVCFYGATSGEAYIRGTAGQRFCVRNSGVTAVVEGVGDHGCEYMTGGVVVVLGGVGRNFAAGMSGGLAFVYDPEKKFSPLCNKEGIDLEKVDYEDNKLLKELIRNHLDLTGSSVAAYILADWDNAIDAFVKVYPRDYKAVLEKKKQQEEELKNA